MKVIKRNGKKQELRKKKIIDAIGKAGYVSMETKQSIADYIANLKRDEITVEEIQDLVEKKLMQSSYKDVAQEYVRYRYKRELIRQTEATNDAILKIVDTKSEEVKDENSNKNPERAAVMRDYMAGEVSKDISKRLLLPDEIVKAHEEGILHFHDMDYFAQKIHNCCLVNLEDMLQNGTVISDTMIEKPHSFLTACNIATQIMAQIASNQYGGQSESLAHLAPFVDISRQSIMKDVRDELLSMKVMRVANKIMPKRFEQVVSNITEHRLRKEVKHGVQTIQYQILTLMTTNGQTPFVTLWMYLGEVPEGQLREDLAMIIEEVLHQRIQGVKNEKGAWITPAFPKLVYALEEDNIRKDSKYYYLTKLAAKCTTKRMVPDYVSERKLLESKYPINDLYTIKYRRDNWGDERIWGNNPFRDMSDEECEILQEYILDKLSGGESNV